MFTNLVAANADAWFCACWPRFSERSHSPGPFLFAQVQGPGFLFGLTHIKVRKLRGP